ncbi:cation diffusion facilitator family transporter [Patescibacteria group bacterium]
MKIVKDKSLITHEHAILVSFLVDISDVVINVIVVMLSGSVTMLSQALQGAVDLLASGFLYVGSKRAKRVADKMHPFGYGRELYLWIFLSGMVMFGVTSTLSFYWGYIRFINPQPITNIIFAFGALILSLFTNGYAFMLSLKRLQKDKPNADIFDLFFRSSLIATRTTLLLDFMGTLASVYGLLALAVYSVTGNYRYDGVGAMLVGVTLAFFAFFILKDVKNFLIGKSVPFELLNDIANCIRSFPEVNSIIDLKATYIGVEKLFVISDINIKDGLNTNSIERLIEDIENNIKHKIPQSAYIHIEPKSG